MPNKTTVHLSDLISVTTKDKHPWPLIQLTRNEDWEENVGYNPPVQITLGGRDELTALRDVIDRELERHPTP